MITAIPSSRSLASATRSYFLITVFFFGALIGGPVLSASAGFTSKHGLSFRKEVVQPTQADSNSRNLKRVTPIIDRYLGQTRLLGVYSVATSPVLAEMIQTFAADCTTPKTDFYLGETVCAKTDGVTATNRFVSWLTPDTLAISGSSTTTSITTNPQTFLFTIPTTSTVTIGGNTSSTIGTWKATIADPSDSSINPTYFTVSPQPPISTYASDCVTPKTVFNLGETICARVEGVSLASPKRFAWVDASGLIRKFTPVSSDPQTDLFTLPAIAADSSGVENRGTWQATLVSSRASVIAAVSLDVKDPQNVAADISATKGLTSANLPDTSGEDVTYVITVANYGPDDAANVQFVDDTPTNTTFKSLTQLGGPTFNCTTPAVGATGTSTCTISTLAWASNNKAFFKVVYTTSATNGVIQSGNVVASSSTNDLSTGNNQQGSPAIGFGGATTQACVLQCPSDITVSANASQNNVSGAFVNFPGADSTGDCGSISASPASGSFFPVGTTPVTASSSSGGGSCVFNVIVVEDQPPSISCPTNISMSGDCTGTNVSVGTPTATGAGVTVDGTRSDGQDLSNPYPAGVTTITWTATDATNRTATCTQTVTINVTDTIPPTISAPADIVGLGTGADSDVCGRVVDEGLLGSPTVDDNCSATFRRTGVPAGNFFPVGTTAVTYTATDAGGNTATAIQHVTVVDNTPPIVRAPADASFTCPSQVPAANAADARGANENLPDGGPPTDNCGSPTITVTQGNNGGAGSASSPLIITRTFTATDSAGNSSQASQTITVIDSTPPTVSAPAPTTGSANSSCLAAIPNVLPGVTASDNCSSGSITLVQNPAAGTLVGLGGHNITITATDAAGNSNTANTSFNVVDTTAPVLACPANIVVYLPANSTATSMAVNYGAPTATDNCSTASVSSSPASGSIFPLGTTTVTASATDAAGNTSTCSFTVKVLYNFTGFFSPVTNLPTLNVVNAGRAIPVKFSLSGNKGLNIFATGSPYTVGITCDGTTPSSDVIETVNAGESSLSYSPDQYNYVWKTDRAWVGTCRQLVIRLNDGSTHAANFRFR